jgi:hypothetical protein
MSTKPEWRIREQKLHEALQQKSEEIRQLRSFEKKRVAQMLAVKAKLEHYQLIVPESTATMRPLIRILDVEPFNMSDPKYIATLSSVAQSAEQEGSW